MTHLEAPLDQVVDPHTIAKTPFTLAAERRKGAKYNSRTLVLALGALGLVFALFFILRMMSAANRGAPKKTDQPSASAPAGAAPVSAQTYAGIQANGAAGAAGAAGATGAAPDCAQYPAYSGCQAGDAAQGAAVAATPATGAAGQTAQLTPAQQAAVAQSQSARTAGVFFPGQSQAGGVSPAQSIAGGLGFNLPAPAPVAGPQLPASAPADVLVGNGQGEKRAFQTASNNQDYVNATLQAPRSPYEVKAGTVIPAALLTVINSDLPGEIIAQVTEPVFDHVTGQFVLIPQGSRLIGRYDSQVAYGQERALVVWSRIIMPNGASIDLGAMEGADPTGASGLHDRVNNHFGKLAEGVLISTLISVGGAAATDAQSRSTGATVINAGASGAAADASNVGNRIVERDLGVQPTIQIRAGMPLRVIVSKDMVFSCGSTRSYPEC
jgi:type IV secretion system protein VirB10